MGLSGFLDKQFDEDEKSRHEHQEKNHVVDVVPVLATPAFAQEIVNFLVGHVRLFAKRHAFIANVVFIVVFDQKTVPIDEKGIIKKVNDEKKAKDVVEVVIRDHGQTGRASRQDRPGCTAAALLWIKVVAPFSL
jgi:hypothetical protein